MTMPPVTTLPEKGSLLQIFQCRRDFSSRVVMVALSQLVSLVLLQNLSSTVRGRRVLLGDVSPQIPTAGVFGGKARGMVVVPSAEFSQLPLVTKLNRPQLDR